jgi:hypothetical protein
MTTKEVVQIFAENHSSYLDSEIGEFERHTQENNPDTTAEELKNKFEHARPIPLPDSIWANLQNTDSWDLEKGDIQKARELAIGYEKDFDYALKSVKEGFYNPPLIIKENEAYTLIGGNTRLMACKVLGIRPKVLLV